MILVLFLLKLIWICKSVTKTFKSVSYFPKKIPKFSKKIIIFQKFGYTS